MNCACHGEPAYWQKDKRTKAGGWWECPRKRKAANQRRTTDPVRGAGIRARRREVWHAPEGGYVKRRRQQLAAARAEILERLDQLKQERDLC